MAVADDIKTLRDALNARAASLQQCMTENNAQIATLADLETGVNAMQAQIDGIPAQLQAQYNQGVTDGKASIQLPAPSDPNAQYTQQQMQDAVNAGQKQQSDQDVAKFQPQIDDLNGKLTQLQSDFDAKVASDAQAMSDAQAKAASDLAAAQKALADMTAKEQLEEQAVADVKAKIDQVQASFDAIRAIFVPPAAPAPAPAPAAPADPSQAAPAPAAPADGSAAPAPAPAQ